MQQSNWGSQSECSIEQLGKREQQQQHEDAPDSNKQRNHQYSGDATGAHQHQQQRLGLHARNQWAMVNGHGIKVLNHKWL